MKNFLKYATVITAAVASVCLLESIGEAVKAISGFASSPVNGLAQLFLADAYFVLSLIFKLSQRWMQ